MKEKIMKNRVLVRVNERNGKKRKTRKKTATECFVSERRCESNLVFSVE